MESVEDPRQTGTPASSAGKRNGAISAEIVATVLDFQETTGTVAERVGQVEIADFENITRVRFLLFLFFEVLQVVGDIEFFSGPQYQAHSVDSHDFFRSELGITSDNYDIGARVVVNNFTDQLPAFFFGHIGHATGIDHKDIGAFFIGYGFSAFFFKAVPDGRRF